MSNLIHEDLVVTIKLLCSESNNLNFSNKTQLQMYHCLLNDHHSQCYYFHNFITLFKNNNIKRKYTISNKKSQIIFGTINNFYKYSKQNYDLIVCDNVFMVNEIIKNNQIYNSRKIICYSEDDRFNFWENEKLKINMKNFKLIKLY